MPSKAALPRTSPRVLVVDVGGTHVKILATGESERRELKSGPHLTARAAVTAVLHATEDWRYDVVALGYPGPVVHGRPLHDPVNLGKGWVRFDFAKAFGCPVRIVNDAAMQALGSYRGGRMLFLGLGTGLGSAMIVDGALQPMELAHLPYRKGRTFEDYAGKRGLVRLGRKRWEKHVWRIVEQLRAALEPDDVVIGGGNAKKLRELAPRTRRVDNEEAFLGGFRLWKAAPETRDSGARKGRRGAR